MTRNIQVVHNAPVPVSVAPTSGPLTRMTGRSTIVEGYGYEPSEPVIVGVGPVSPDEVIAVARRGARVELSDEALAKIEEGRSVIDALARDSRPHYGVSTGFGALATKHIPAERRVQLQRGVVRSHAAGSGAEVEREVVRAMMLLRLSTMATGRTGIRTVTAAAYAATLSAGITPVVPEYGVESTTEQPLAMAG